MKKKKQAIAATSIYFPEEILENIFIRLPRRSLMRFKCVSKYFCALFSSRGFQNMHHELSNIRNGASNIMGFGEELWKIDYKSVSSLLPLSTSSTTTCEEITNQVDYPSIFLDCDGVLDRDGVEYLSSCDGLVWIRLKIFGEYSCYFSEEYYIWNPTTNLCEEIPMVPGVLTSDIVGYGFCKDYKTNDYKLVAVEADWGSKCSDVHVYTLGYNSWKTFHGMPYDLDYTRHSKSNEGVLFNGAFQWLARTFGGKSTLLVRIDVVNGRFQEVALPELPMLYPEDPDMSVGVLGGCLSLITRDPDVVVDVWIMQEYGAKVSWAKSFSITQESIISTGRCLNLVWSFKNNETLWEVEQGFVLYDPNNKTYRRLMWDSDYAEG